MRQATHPGTPGRSTPIGASRGDRPNGWATVPGALPSGRGHRITTTPGFAATVHAVAGALLRTLAWLYGGLWVVVATTEAGSVLRGVALTALAPLAPVILLATTRGLLARRDLRATVAPQTPATPGPTAAEAFLRTPWSAPLSPNPARASRRG